MKLKVNSPVFNTSGIFSYLSRAKRLEIEGAKSGAFITKTIFYNENFGNKNSVMEYPYNSMGLPSQGVEAWVDEFNSYYDKRKRSFEIKTPIIASVSAYNTRDQRRVVETLEDDPVCRRAIIAFEDNTACPNRTPGKKSLAESIGSNPKYVRKITEDIREVTKKPIITKIMPDVSLAPTIFAAYEGGSDLLGCSNTHGPGMPLDEKRRPILRGIFGGMSGPAIKDLNLRVVKEASDILGKEGIEMEIVAYGGIGAADGPDGMFVNVDQAVDDILDYARYGASYVGLGTTFRLFSTKQVVQYTIDLHDELKKHMKGGKIVTKD